MSAETDLHIVILGAGQAAGAVVASLRQFGFEGPITMVGEEPAPPYQRPPLSKAYFKGEMTQERLYMKPRAFYDEKNITLKLGKRVGSIDAPGKAIVLEDGERIAYDKLVIATGSRARTLPVAGAELDGVLVLRTLADVDDLRPRATEGKSLVVVGAGYIGLEAAAVATQLGLKVTVLEAADRVLGRVTSPFISEYYQNVHRAKGVDVRLNARMECFVGENGKLTGVKMADGEIIPADIVLVGIGILPNQEIAQEAGIECRDGILANDDSLTSNPDVYAIGDCARRPFVHYEGEGRLESVHNALEQAKLAAAHICDKDRPKRDAPWFWSDQYDLKLQTVGLLTGFDQVVVRGEPANNKFAVYYLKDGKFLAVDCVNSPPEFLSAKKLVGANVTLDPEQLRNTDINIKEIAEAALAAATA